MIAIAQSGHNYHYLNWIASEVGPIVTGYGKIIKVIDNVEDFKQKHYEIFSEIKFPTTCSESLCARFRHRQCMN